MKVTYLSHSGYMIEDGGTVLIFDYYKGRLPKPDRQMKIYVFASHSHPDHFNKKIFEWEKMYSDIHYILSEDIDLPGPDGKTMHTGPYQELHHGELKIRTLCSTDKGVAFVVCLHGKVVYHAGDMNWWHWKEEDEAYNKMMCQRYQREIGRIEGERLDAAFLPLDPRQEEQYYWGFDYFMRHTDTRCAFPMHMWGRYDICDKLLKEPVSEPYRDKIMRVQKPLQIFEI